SHDAIGAGHSGHTATERAGRALDGPAAVRTSAGAGVGARIHHGRAQRDLSLPRDRGEFAIGGGGAAPQTGTELAGSRTGGVGGDSATRAGQAAAPPSQENDDGGSRL